MLEKSGIPSTMKKRPCDHIDCKAWAVQMIVTHSLECMCNDTSGLARLTPFLSGVVWLDTMHTFLPAPFKSTGTEFSFLNCISEL